MVENQEEYDRFLSRLDFFKKKRLIVILKRGMTKKFAFKRVKLDPKYSPLDQFAERLFFYGEKSKYFWEQRFGRRFGINDTGKETFMYIFEKFNEIAKKKDCNSGTTNYRNRNRKAFDFFTDTKNLKIFLRIFEMKDEDTKRQLKNYYFRIIHQLGETDYKRSSLNISGTQNEDIAKHFSNSEIIINFWDFNFKQFKPEAKNVPLFEGEPYRNQEEISVFGVIFPHYIFSFEYKNQMFYNPAILKRSDYDSMILGGFEIDQKEFRQRFKKETSYEIGLLNYGERFSELL